MFGEGDMVDFDKESLRYQYRIPFKRVTLPVCENCRFWSQEKLDADGCTHEIEGGNLRWDLLGDNMSPSWGHCLLTISEDDEPNLRHIAQTKAWARDNEKMFAVLQTHARFSCCQFREKEKENG